MIKIQQETPFSIMISINQHTDLLFLNEVIIPLMIKYNQGMKVEVLNELARIWNNGDYE